MANSDIKVGKELGDVASQTLRFFKQIGVEAVGMPARYNLTPGTNPTKRPLIPPTQKKPAGPIAIWHEDELQQVKQAIVDGGLKPWLMSLGLSGAILMGQTDRDADIEQFKHNIILAGKLGIKVITYNFTALRASEGYGARYGWGRGGSDWRDFDYERIRDLPLLNNVGRHSREAMWDRIAYFLRAVIPTAEAAEIRLALHPNDPPVPEYRGVAQPLFNLDGLKQIISIVDSPANSIYFDTGVTTEMGEDAPTAIRYFGQRDRIGTVHFRNVQVEKPHYKYVESFHDNGDCDLSACMRAFHQVGYRGMIDPDHTPTISDDTSDTRMGWAFAIGQIIALRQATLT